MEFIIVILVGAVLGALSCLVEVWYYKKRERDMLRNMVIIDFFETYFFDSQVMMSVRQYRDKYYLVMCKEGSESKVLCDWDKL
ncbi:MAG: hypothetical protein IJX63_01800 [Lachnospiraceae bacterium]|nr:hypothetical protein [Lachnospiraceae bacterium]